MHKAIKDKPDGRKKKKETVKQCMYCEEEVYKGSYLCYECKCIGDEIEYLEHIESVNNGETYF